MTEPEQPRRVTIELEEGYRFRADFGDDLGSLLLDEPAPVGADEGPNAAAVLAAAVGNCLSASLLFCLRRARVDVDALQAEVEVSSTRNADGRKRIDGLDVVIRPVLDEGSAEGRYRRCVDIFEDYCVVTGSVRQGIDVSVRVEPASAPDGRSGEPGTGRA